MFLNDLGFLKLNYVEFFSKSSKSIEIRVHVLSVDLTRFHHTQTAVTFIWYNIF